MYNFIPEEITETISVLLFPFSIDFFSTLCSLVFSSFNIRDTSSTECPKLMQEGGREPP